MAVVTWTGNAAAVAQVDTLTVGGTLEATDILIATINGKALSVIAGSTVLATAATTFATAWNNCTFPEFTEITALGVGATITLTADTPGKPFTVTASTTETGGGAADSQTFIKSSTTANSGPNVFAAANFDTAALPSAGDTLIIDGSVSNASILYGLDQSGIGILAAVKVVNNYNGKIGLPEYATVGSQTYPEYRGTSLQLSITALTVQANSGRLKFNTLTDPCALVVRTTGNSESTNIPCLQWIGVDVLNTVSVDGGSVGIAFKASSVATVATLRMSGGDVFVGSGVTLTTATKSGGSIAINCAATTVTQNGGTARIQGTGTIATLNNNQSCTVYHESTATITTYVGSGGSLLDLDASAVPRTVTNATLNDTARVRDTNLTVTWTNDIILYGDIAGRVLAGRQFTITPQ